MSETMFARVLTSLTVIGVCTVITSGFLIVLGHDVPAWYGAIGTGAVVGITALARPPIKNGGTNGTG